MTELSNIIAVVGADYSDSVMMIAKKHEFFFRRTPRRAADNGAGVTVKRNEFGYGGDLLDKSPRRLQFFSLLLLYFLI